MIQFNLKIMSTCLLFNQMILAVLDMHAVMIGDLSKGNIIFKTQTKRGQAACSRRWVAVFWVNYSTRAFGDTTLIIREEENLSLSSRSEVTRPRRRRPFYMDLSLDSAYIYQSYLELSYSCDSCIFLVLCIEHSSIQNSWSNTAVFVFMLTV